MPESCWVSEGYMEWFVYVNWCETYPATGKCHALRCSDSLWTLVSVWAEVRGQWEEDMDYVSPVALGLFFSAVPCLPFFFPLCPRPAPCLHWAPAETARWSWASVSGPAGSAARQPWWPWPRASWEGTCSVDLRDSPSNAAAERGAPSRCLSQTRIAR